MKPGILITTTLFIASLTACNNSCSNNPKAHTHEDCSGHERHVHEHAHDESLQLTAYGSDFEVFTEATPFVVGQESSISAYFSHLENFKPLREGKVTASLIVGADGIRQTLNEPSRTGIYLFRLIPTVAGSGEILFDIETSSGKYQVVIPGVTVYTDTHEAYEAAAEAEPTNSNGVTFTKEQSWKVDFATAEVRRESFGQMIRTTAQIQPSPGDERILVAKAGGTASFNVPFVEGIAVTAGQTLFTIDGSVTVDNNLAVRYAGAESEYNRAKAEYGRKVELAKDNLVSQSDLLKARTEYANAEAHYLLLKRNFAEGKQSVSSPIDGFVTRVLVQNGQYVEEGQPVLVVSQNRDLLLVAELQPSYFDLLNRIASANIRIPNSNRTFTLEELNGRVFSYGKSVNAANPLVPVVFRIDNKVGLLAGSFVELFIKTQTDAQALTVSNEAIMEEMGHYFVFVQCTPELFEKRAVKTGVTDGVRTEIREGVAAGERVVSKGAILVKLAQAAGTLDAHAGHVH